MNQKIRPLPPVKVKINFSNQLKLVSMILVSFLLWIILFVTGINIMSYYFYNLYIEGIFDTETLKYATMLVAGAYLFLILDKKKIEEALNIKRDLPFIEYGKEKKK